MRKRNKSYDGLTDKLRAKRAVSNLLIIALVMLGISGLSILGSFISFQWFFNPNLEWIFIVVAYILMGVALTLFVKSIKIFKKYKNDNK